MTLKILAELPIRSQDGYGSGAYGAPRGKDRAGNPRFHEGVDLEVPTGSVILSPISGKVTKIGYPYKQDFVFRYVQVTDHEQQHWRFMYLSPVIEKDALVEPGTPLGRVQDLTKRYPTTAHRRIKNHVHLEVRKWVNGEYIYFDPFTDQTMA